MMIYLLEYIWRVSSVKFAKNKLFVKFENYYSEEVEDAGKILPALGSLNAHSLC